MYFCLLLNFISYIMNELFYINVQYCLGYDAILGKCYCVVYGHIGVVCNVDSLGIT